MSQYELQNLDTRQKEQARLYEFAAYDFRYGMRLRRAAWLAFKRGDRELWKRRMTRARYWVAEVHLALL
jgi:hypothetical protein